MPATREPQFPANPPKQALAYFQKKQLRPSFDYRAVWREEQAFAFTIAKSTAADILKDVYEGLQDALKDGKTFHQFQKELTPLLVKKGWWGKQTVVDPKTGEAIEAQLGSPRRLKIIYDTNLRTARAAGQWQRLEQTKHALPYLLYELGPSRKHRQEHLAFAGTILAVDDPFWKTHTPPNGWGCKCRIRALTRSEAKRRGGASESPTVETIAWHNKRTGFTETVPQGIDPGFDTNPGKVRLAFDRAGRTGTVKALPEQKTWRDYHRADVREIPETLKLKPPPLLERAKDQEAANQIAEDFFIPQGQTLGMLKTPIEDILLERGNLRHLVAKREEARERFLPLLKQTLEHPFEVWRVLYQDGIRHHYIGLLQGDKNRFSLVRVNKDGSLFWNAFPKRNREINKSRIGHLIYGK